MSYQHLTLEERYCLAEFREKGLSRPLLLGRALVYTAPTALAGDTVA